METLELLKEAFRDSAFGKNAVCKSYAKFKGGWESVQDDPHIGCPLQKLPTAGE